MQFSIGVQDLYKDLKLVRFILIMYNKNMIVFIQDIRPHTYTTSIDGKKRDSNILK